MESFKRKLYTWITGHCKLVVTVFLTAMVICIAMWRMVGVNYDIKDFLPEDSSSTVAIKVMEREYAEGVPNARVMLKDVSVPEAMEYKEKIQAIDGVVSVVWLDDSVNAEVPLELADQDFVKRYYKDGNALFSLTIDKDKILTAVADIREVVGDEAAMTGDAVSTEVATVSTLREISLLTVLAVVVVLLILIFATEAWIEPFLVLISLGVAIFINAGTNLIFGEVSFVTNGAGNVLLLAVSLDYSVFLLHRFHECREETDSPREGMIEALCRSTGSIMSSGLTTVIGFLSLVLMRFLLGPDLGLASAKGVIISLITAFVFLPAWIMLTYKWIEKTRHKSLMPDFTRLGKLVVKTMIPMICVFALVIAPSFLASNSNDYYYGASKIFGADTKLGKDNDAVAEVFGENDNYVLMVPKGDLAKEKELSDELHQLDEVTAVLSYVDTVGAEIPVEYLSEDLASQLNSKDFTRFVISVEAASEGHDTFALVDKIHDLAQNYYSDEFYLAGAGPSYHDLMKTISSDMMKVNLVAIAAVYLILALMMRSVLLPALLVLSIETAIWVNVAVPYFSGTTVFYISYLIITVIQLGATVDYAILMTDRYRECRQTMGKKEAVVETVASSVPSILVSGLALTTVGFLLGNISSHGILAMLGVFLGRGAILSLFIVIFVLPGLLYLFDKLYINRGKYKMKKSKIVIGLMVACLLTVSPAAAFAGTDSAKEEVIYGNLGHDGSVEKVYAVNIFEDEKVIDYGNYTDVKNLTTTDKISLKNGKVSVDAAKTPFYYEGTLKDMELPWDIKISYSLDGSNYRDAESLAGKSGALAINIDIDKGGSSFFYSNYALQITMVMDGNYCRNIKADGATVANVGSDKQIVYTVLPGKGADITVTSDVTNFEMDQISINGVKMGLDVDIDTSSIESRAKDLEDGAARLYDGAEQMDSGVSEMDKGISGLGDGAAELGKGISELDEKSVLLEQRAVQISSAVKVLSQSVGSAAWKSALSNNGLSVDQLKQGNNDLVDQITALLNRDGDSMSDQQKQLYNQIIVLARGNNGALSGTETYLDTINRRMEPLRNGAQALQEGSSALAEGSKRLKAASGKLQEGIGKLQYGSDGLKNGADLLKIGTGQLKDSTSGIDKQISGEISKVKEGLTGSDEVRSFISEKNTNVKSVQFVMKTEPIKIPEPESTDVQPEKEKTFLQKLVDLFK